jgi:hypothetical protein
MLEVHIVHSEEYRISMTCEVPTFAGHNQVGESKFSFSMWKSSRYRYTKRVGKVQFGATSTEKSLCVK